MNDDPTTLGATLARVQLAARLRGMTLDDLERWFRKPIPQRAFAAARAAAQERPDEPAGDHARAFRPLVNCLGCDWEWIRAGRGRAPKGYAAALAASLPAPVVPAPTSPVIPPPAPAARPEPTIGAVAGRALDVLDGRCESEDAFVARQPTEVDRRAFRHVFNSGRGNPHGLVTAGQIDRLAAALPCDRRWLATGEGTPDLAPACPARNSAGGCDDGADACAPACSGARPAPPRADLALRAFVFEGRTLHLREFRGHWCIPAREWGDVLGYTDPGKLTDNVRGPWAGECAEGTDYLLLDGADLLDFGRGNDTTESVASFGRGGARSMLVLTEDGMYLTALLARTEVGKRARAWVKGTVLPALRRGEGGSLPGQASPPATLDAAGVKAIMRDALPAMVVEVVREVVPAIVASLDQHRPALPAQASPAGRQLSIRWRSRPAGSVEASELKPRVQRVCIEKGWTLAELSRRLPRQEDYLAKVFGQADRMDHRTVMPATVALIALAAQCSFDWLCTGRGVPFPKAQKPTPATPPAAPAKQN